jgi:uncharacterized SAM-binding protein YcdF (DUF218 family)
MIRKVFRALVRGLACLGALLLLVTLLPPRWYVRELAGEWRDPGGRVLIVLGNDSLDVGILGEGSYWRSVYAVLAWREGGFRRMVLSGESSVTGPMRDFIVCQGVPAETVIVEDRSTSTRENALFAAETARQFPGPYVLLTSDYHMWRAWRAFRKAGLNVEPRPFPDAGKHFNDWHQRWSIFLGLADETGKIVYYRARGWI